MRNGKALLSHGVVAFTAIAVFGGTARAAVIETQYNPVADNAINTAAGNNDRSDWASIPSYGTDPDEAATSDWNRVSVAHDSGNIYLHYAMNRTTFSGFLDGSQSLYIDTDQNRATGFTGGGGHFAVGAEFLLQGASLFSFGGGSSQTTWSWNWVGGVTYDDFPTSSHELTLPRGSLGNPVDFDFMLLAEGSPNDYYPDASNAGAEGDYFTYSTVPVPEPAAMGLTVVGLGLIARRRKV